MMSNYTNVHDISFDTCVFKNDNVTKSQRQLDAMMRPSLNGDHLRDHRENLKTRCPF